MNYIDLHIHSTFSDGVHSPEELVLKAADLGLTGLSLTDHDTVSGLDTFILAARQSGVRIVTGVELSAWHQGHSIHILGYGFNIRHPALKEGLAQIQQARQNRNNAIIKKLETSGIIICHGDLTKLAGDQIGRPHFAQVLINKGIVKRPDEAFARFLGKKGKAYVAREKFPAAEAISMIKKAGGLAVLAHPGNIDPSYSSLPGLIISLKAEGIDGIEAYHPSHSPTISARLLYFAQKENLLITFGSDYHADPRWNILLTRFSVPEEIQKNALQTLQVSL